MLNRYGVVVSLSFFGLSLVLALDLRTSMEQIDLKE